MKPVFIGNRTITNLYKEAEIEYTTLARAIVQDLKERKENEQKRKNKSPYRQS